jgi:hypothetical protein
MAGKTNADAAFYAVFSGFFDSKQNDRAFVQYPRGFYEVFFARARGFDFGWTAAIRNRLTG